MSRLAQFGLFEADLDGGELRKQGRLVRIQQQPFELLKALIERPNTIVTRDDLRRRLWASDVVVDFDQALNKSVTKLRDALGDSAASPRFVETIPKRGYRFLAAVTIVELLAASQTKTVEPALSPTPAVPPTAWQPPMVISVVTVLGLVLALLTVGPWRRKAEPAMPPAIAAFVDPQTTDLYARGRLALSRRSEGSLRSATGLFGNAVALDPGYSPAYVGLADAWSLLSSYGSEDPQIAMRRARDYANRALAIDPESAEAHASLGRTTMLADWDWQTAEWHFRRAIEIRPNYSTAHQWYANLLSATGRHGEAEGEARKAAALDPLSLSAETSVGYVLYAARRFDDAAAALGRVIQVDPDFMQARKNLGLVRIAQGRYTEAISEFERVVRLSGGSAVAQADLAWARGRAGDLTEARRLVKAIQSKSGLGYVPPDSLTLALAGSGQVDRAVAVMETAFSSRVPGLARLAVDPRWDALRDVPRVRAMADAIRAGTTASDRTTY